MQPVSSNEDVGQRMHEVNKERAVDRAIERLRHGLRADWHYLTGDDYTNLRWVIGEIWATVSREEWDSLYFSKLDIERTRRLVSVGDRLRRHHTDRTSAMETAMTLVSEAAAVGSGATEGFQLAN